MAQLGEYSQFFTVYQEGSFSHLGIIRHRRKNLLTFFVDPTYRDVLYENQNISSVITSEELTDCIPPGIGIAISNNPRKSFLYLHNHLATETDFYRRKEFVTNIDPSSYIDPTAHISPMNVEIGNDCIIGPHVVINTNTIIQNNVHIGANAVIGTEGFYPKRYGGDVYMSIHTGGVLIEEQVEIQVGCAVSKGVFGGDTVIRKESKIANLVDIAHDVIIGPRTFIAAGAVISGNTTLGRDVWIGPNATISNNLTIGDGVSVSLGAVVTQDVPSASRVSGNFAINHKKFITYLKSIR